MVKASLLPDERINFFVHMIESPNPADLYHKRHEGEILEKALSLDEIPSAHRIVVNSTAFRAAFSVGVQEEMKRYSNLVPIIHISSHGSSKGIQLTDGTIIDWHKLKDILVPINKALKGGLILCMSACEGHNACRMAMSEAEEEFPFFAVVGHMGKPTWSDTAIAYAAFYHLIKKGCTVLDAVKAMCEASGDDGFQATTSVWAKKAFLDTIGKAKAPRVRAVLGAEIDKKPLAKKATLLEKN